MDGILKENLLIYIISLKRSTFTYQNNMHIIISLIFYIKVLLAIYTYIYLVIKCDKWKFLLKIYLKIETIYWIMQITYSLFIIIEFINMIDYFSHCGMQAYIRKILFSFLFIHNGWVDLSYDEYTSNKNIKSAPAQWEYI